MTHEYVNHEFVGMRLDAECECVEPGGALRLALGLQVGPPSESGSGPRPPIDLVLALDTSGSMAGAPIRQVAEAARRIVERLEDGDRVGLVRFASRAELVVALGAPRDAVLAALVGLEGRGGTAIEAGLALATQAVVADPSGAERRGVVLLSDGAATVGAQGPDALAALARRGAGELSLSTLGFGPHHDEAALTAIADAGGGRYAWVADPALAGLAFARAIGDLADQRLAGVAFAVRPLDGSRLVECPPEAHPRADGVELRLGGLEAGARRRLAFGLVAGRAGAGLEVERLGGRSPARGERVELRVPAAPVRRPAASESRAEVLLAHGEAARAEARDEAARGRAARGLARLDGWLALARADGPRAPGHPLSELVEQVVDDREALRRGDDREGLVRFLRGQRARVDPGPEAEGRAAASLGAAEVGRVPEAVLEILDGPEAGGRRPVGASLCIGRTPSADLVLPLPTVSRRHARIFTADGLHWLEDLGSTQASRLNGERLVASRPLRAGDEIDIGGVRLRYRLGPGAPGDQR